MSSATRILILGLLSKLDSSHGYDIRHELETWNAEQWANIAYGSIYFALNKMAEEGLVKSINTEQAGARPAKISYSITDNGKEEFQRLLREYWWELKPTIDPFQVALTFMDHLSNDELLLSLNYRADMLRVNIKGFAQSISMIMKEGYKPRHLEVNLRLSLAHMETELRWIEDVIGKVERGELP
jgi:DNA-binding PadR family transcriptional regulator